MSSRLNNFLDHGFSDASDNDAGYDSEAAELSKTARRPPTSDRSVKRRKLSHSPSGSDAEEDDGEDFDQSFVTAKDHLSPVKPHIERTPVDKRDEDSTVQQEPEPEPEAEEIDYTIKSARKLSKPRKPQKQKKEQTPGVIYLSSLPPYLKPSALRNLLQQRGFEPITRLFLAPASKHKHASKKNSRQLYTEGWIEFASKKTARRCAEALNAQMVGGKKGGFYHDDLWNMKYLKGMAWEELMSGIREERREEEGRRDEERRRVASETKSFVEGVEEGRKMQGIQRKRKAKYGEYGEDNDVKRTWRQFEVKGAKPSAKGAADGGGKAQEKIGDDVRVVLGKIF